MDLEAILGTLAVMVVLITVLGSAVYGNAQSTTGITTLSFPVAGAAANVTPVMTSLSISQAGPTLGPNAKVTVWDGPIGTGTVIWAAFLSGPGIPGGAGSVGIIQDMPLPLSPSGNNMRLLQATTGNQMNVQVTGTGGNQVSINARFSDGIPTGV